MEEHRLALPVGYRLDCYEIQGVLGKGGFGLTYVAYDWGLKRHMAIKELLPDSIATRLDGSTVVAQSASREADWQWARERFLEEARTLAGFRHPNIVAVQRLVEANGTVYLVMDHLEGESYEARLRRITCEPDEASLRAVIDPLLDGLREVHAAGLLHRDIKPENILFDRRGQPVLIDFGAARASIGATVTMTSIVTHGYSPIEQYQTKGRMGPWTDIYAMGAVMHRAITGEKPPVAADRVINDELEPLAARYDLAGYSRKFILATDWAMQVRPEQRPQSIQEWHSALSGEGSVTPAKPPDPELPPQRPDPPEPHQSPPPLSKKTPDIQAIGRRKLTQIRDPKIQWAVFTAIGVLIIILVAAFVGNLLNLAHNTNTQPTRFIRNPDEIPEESAEYFERFGAPPEFDVTVKGAEKLGFKNPEEHVKGFYAQKIADYALWTRGKIKPTLDAALENGQIEFSEYKSRLRELNSATMTALSRAQDFDEKKDRGAWDAFRAEFAKTLYSSVKNIQELGARINPVFIINEAVHGREANPFALEYQPARDVRVQRREMERNIDAVYGRLPEFKGLAEGLGAGAASAAMVMGTGFAGGLAGSAIGMSARTAGMFTGMAAIGGSSAQQGYTDDLDRQWRLHQERGGSKDNFEPNYTQAAFKGLQRGATEVGTEVGFGLGVGGSTRVLYDTLGGVDTARRLWRAERIFRASRFQSAVAGSHFTPPSKEVTGALSGVVQNLSGTNPIRSVFSKRGMLEIARNTFGEASEEFATPFIDTAYDSVSGTGEDASWIVKENVWTQAKDGALVGAIVGFSMGSVHTVGLVSEGKRGEKKIARMREELSLYVDGSLDESSSATYPAKE